jgi:hypothetical protein
MDVKICVCLPRKYDRFMLFIDNNLLLPGARLHILNVFANNSVFNLHFMKVSTENDNNFGHEKITIVGPFKEMSCHGHWKISNLSSTQIINYCYETLFFRYKKADHHYWKLINYSLTWARPNLFLSIFMPVARMLQHGC